MTSQPLPDRPNLEHLKKLAKSLLHAARAQDARALERFRALPPLASKSIPELGAMNLALHDAQAVIAREHGFRSWTELREHVEERLLSFEAAVDEFVRSATGNARERALRLLTLHPAIAHANLYTELLLGDAQAVQARLQGHPEAAVQPGGIQNWAPLLYVCHTCLHGGVPERAAGLVRIARTLLQRGANPNAEYHWNWHPELPRTALWASLCVVEHLPLAEALLEAGANPTDGVSTHITAGGNNIAALELLHRFGMNVNGIPGGVPPLCYILNWAATPTSRATGVGWLLEHGADPNLAWGAHDIAPIHVAAQRWDVDMIELLVRHGADIHRRRADGRTAHALAELHGNQDIAAWLLAHGAKDELSILDRFVSACARGDRARAEALLQAHPNLRSELQEEHHLMMHVPADRGDAKVLETMLACGFDPNVKDREGVTALHRASMGGGAEAVRVLLEHGAAVNALDGMFAASPLVWASEGWSHAAPGKGDYPAVARLLIAAGCSLEWIPPAKAPSAEGTQERLTELIRIAGQAPVLQ
jgi:ankyrin repeat protein